MICPHCGKFIDDDRKRVATEGKTQEKKFIDMTFMFVRESDKAIAVDWFGENIWMPKSQLKTLDGGQVGGYAPNETITIQVSQWIAKEKGLIEHREEEDPRKAAENRLKAKTKTQEDIPF